MAKKKQPQKTETVTNVTNVTNVGGGAVQNGLSDALGANNAFNLPSQGFPGTEQLSNTNTIFKNLRWYLVSNFRQVLSELYVEIGLVQTIVDVPVDDGLRGGLTIKSKQLEEEQIQELQLSLERDGDLHTAKQAAKWNRLFGGAGIVIMTDQDPELPLDLESITPDTPLEFRAVDMWELFWDLQNTEGYDATIQTENIEHYTYYGEKLHKSRVMKLKGFEAPSFIRPRLRGWGFSVCEVLVRSINQYLKATDLGFEVLDEFKLDVYKIKNLVNTLMSPAGQQKIQQRVQLANWQKNYQNAVVMDSEDDFDHKQLSFAGLAEAMAGIRMQVAADLRMPITKLFGQSVSGGIGNNDQNDMENYNSMVESQVRDKLKFDLLRICEIKCQKLFGLVPDDLEIVFKPLRVLSAEQEENVKTQKFNRLMQAKAAGEITTYEFRESCNKGNLFDVTLDNAGDALNPNDPQVADLVVEGVGGKDEADESGEVDSLNPDEAAPKEEKAFKKSKSVKTELETKEKRKRTTGEPANDEPDNEEPENKEPKTKEPAVKNDKFVKAFGEAYRAQIDKEVPPFSTLERIERILKNSAAFDRASYEADGGDGWIHPGREELFRNPMNVDQGLWAKAKAASVAAFGKDKWQFVVWFYKKQGGKF